MALDTDSAPREELRSSCCLCGNGTLLSSPALFGLVENRGYGAAPGLTTRPLPRCATSVSLATSLSLSSRFYKTQMVPVPSSKCSEEGGKS